MERYSIEKSYFWVFESAVFVIACLFYKQLFKKYIWKILHYCQCALFFIYLATFCHLLAFYYNNGFKKISAPYNKFATKLWNADIDLLAESMASPPIVHILSARGTEKPRANQDSTRIIVSNAVYYVFIGLLGYMIKRYCEHIIGATLLYTEFSPCSSFFFWPIYFSYFYLGDYYTLIYFLLNGIQEFLVMAITLYCLVEVVSCEWRWMKPWCIAVSLCVMTITITSSISVNNRAVIYIYVTAIVTLVESIVIFCLYPLGRLIDDIVFHCGSPPTTLRIWTFRIVPLFYMVKIFFMFKGFLYITQALKNENAFIKYDFHLLYLQVIPFILGSFYAVYNNVYRKKENWKQLFVPVPEWGPKNPTLRRLRNQFDSRQYIGSQAPRELSRYLIEKTDLTTYQVDVQYESHYRQREYQINMRFEDEKKCI